MFAGTFPFEPEAYDHYLQPLNLTIGVVLFCPFKAVAPSVAL
jgi:hypothetical protein